MRLTRTIELDGLLATIELLTTDALTHSKATDHPYVVEDVLEKLHANLTQASDEFKLIPSKEVRVSEGC